MLYKFDGCKTVRSQCYTNLMAVNSQCYTNLTAVRL